MAQSAHNPPESAASGAEAAQVDIDSILAEVQGLRAVADSVTPKPVHTPEPAIATGELDFSALERDIEALLSGNNSGAAAIAQKAPVPVPTPTLEPIASQMVEPAAPAPIEAAPSPPAPSAASIRADAFLEPPTDPLIAEIERTLADDSDSLIAASGGVAAALDAVFDQKAFASQEDDIQRAMIDARGSSRVPQPTFSTPISHPAPKFDGTSRGTTGSTVAGAAAAPQPKPAISNVVAAKVEISQPSAEYAGEKPFEAAFPAVPPTKPETLATRVQQAAAAAGVPAPATADPIAKPAVEAAAAPSSEPAMRAEPASATASEQRVATGPGLLSRLATRVASTSGRALRATANAPAVVLAVPMRFVPDSARVIVGIAAITMVLWVPVAWWMALTNSRAQGVGPVELVVREAPEGGEAKAESAESGAGAEPAKAAH